MQYEQNVHFVRLLTYHYAIAFKYTRMHAEKGEFVADGMTTRYRMVSCGIVMVGTFVLPSTSN